MRKNDKYLGMCGLNCSKCGAFIATKNNDNQLREKTAQEWTARYRNDGRNRSPIKPKDINCNGCLSAGPIYLYCRQCKIRKCGLGKGLKNCKECKDYKCEQLIELQSHFY
jgi:hypothetical protein